MKQFIIKTLGIIFFLSVFPTVQVAAQEEYEEVVKRLEKKFDAVEHNIFRDTDVYCVKKNNVWEFADEKGKLLTNMHITDVENNWFTLTITINDVKYDVVSPFADGKMLVSRYDRYAYMDKKGKLITNYIYDYSGDETYEESASTEYILINDLTAAFLEIPQDDVTSSTFNEYISLLNMSNALMLTETHAEALTEFIYDYTSEHLDEVDKSGIDKLYELMYSKKDATSNTLKAITGYRLHTATSNEEKFTLLEKLIKRVDDAETFACLGALLLEGKGCQKDVQRAINCFEKATEEQYDRYADIAKQQLRKLWQSDGAKYKNPYGELLTRYDNFTRYELFIEVEKDGLKGICDTMFTEVLPCKYENVEEGLPPYYVIKTDNGLQLVTTGGKALTADNYDGMRLLKSKDDYFYCFVQRNDKWGILDEQGNTVTSMVFDDVRVSTFLFISVSLTKDGEDYMLIERFRNGRAIVFQNGLNGLMDTNGNIVVPCVYKEIEAFKDGDTTTEATTQDDRIVTIKIK